LEADVLEQLDDARGAMAALERLLWIAPYEESAHSRLAALAAVQGDHARAVRERRAVVALRPSDPLEARYQLARALSQAGDRGAARREILAVLEQAPGFEKAQLLLLELRSEP
jgi:predicted Zn-dependent protease